MNVPRLQRPLRVLSWAGAWGAGLRAGVSLPFERETGLAVEAVRHVALDCIQSVRQTRGAYSNAPIARAASCCIRAVMASTRLRRSWAEEQRRISRPTWRRAGRRLAACGDSSVCPTTALACTR